jgi:hypothetical protein
VRQEGLGKLKKKCNDLIGKRTHDLTSCNISPQPLLYRVPNPGTGARVKFPMAPKFNENSLRAEQLREKRKNGLGVV